MTDQAQVDREFAKLTGGRAEEVGRFIGAVTVLAVGWFILVCAGWGALTVGQILFG